MPQREQRVSVGGLLPERQGQNLVLTVLYVPYLLDSGLKYTDGGCAGGGDRIHPENARKSG